MACAELTKHMAAVAISAHCNADGEIHNVISNEKKDKTGVTIEIVPGFTGSQNCDQNCNECMTCGPSTVLLNAETCTAKTTLVAPEPSVSIHLFKPEGFLSASIPHEIRKKAPKALDLSPRNSFGEPVLTIEEARKFENALAYIDAARAYNRQSVQGRRAWRENLSIFTPTWSMAVGTGEPGPENEGARVAENGGADNDNDDDDSDDEDDDDYDGFSDNSDYDDDDDDDDSHGFSDIEDGSTTICCDAIATAQPSVHAEEYNTKKDPQTVIEAGYSTLVAPGDNTFGKSDDVARWKNKKEPKPEDIDDMYATQELLIQMARENEM